MGSLHYTAWCDDAGKVLDDGTPFRHGAEDYLLYCRERHLPWLLDSAIGYAVQMREVTDEIDALSVRGPCAATTVANAGLDVSMAKPFRMASFAFHDTALMISRTEFAGDLGYQLWRTPTHALDPWNALMAAGPIAAWPIGTNALNLARIEAQFIITNLDFILADQAVPEDRVRLPFELALDWVIDWDKGHFTGRRALMTERERGSEWPQVGLDVDGNLSAEWSLI